MATVFASLQVNQGIEQDALRQFGFSCDPITLKIQERLGAYALILRGGAALFSGSKSVARQEWQDYVERLRPLETVPGVQGIGFAQIIPPDPLATHVARIRGEGFPAYSVRQPGERAIYRLKRIRVLVAGMDDVLTKPVAFDILQAALSKWLPAQAAKVMAAPGADQKPVDSARVATLVEELLPLLAQNKCDAIDCFSVLQEAVAGTHLAAEIGETGRLIEALRFDQALERLRRMAAAYAWRKTA